MDSFGVGYLPDAAKYGDQGAATLQNIIKQIPQLHIPNLRQMGLFNIDGLLPELAVYNPTAMFCKAASLSVGKDTLVGHWELMGIVTTRPFETFPQGFPESIIRKFENEIGKKVMGNVVSSGTTLLDVFGDEHIATGLPIVYTSADSVFQIAAHEDIIPLQTLYDYCIKAKNMLRESSHIGRVIARPFKGSSGAYYRTESRKDYLISAPEKTVLTLLEDNRVPVLAIGKIEDIFDRVGISASIHTKNNADGIKTIISEGQKMKDGLIFANLVDYDMLFGHRRDVAGYATALEVFDRAIPEIISCLGSDDCLIITADHGCDPSYSGTDHTREYIPILIYGNSIVPRNEGVRNSFADVGATILNFYGIQNPFDSISIC